MPIPDVDLEVLDGALGIAPENAINVLAIAGTSSAGPMNVPMAFSDSKQVQEIFGTGQLVECAAYILNIAGGSVVLTRTAASVAGANSAVVKVGTGTSVGSLSGTPLDSYLAQVLIVAGAAAVTSGEGTFQYTLDGGKTWSEVTSLPTAGNYAIPGTGITLTFAVGTLVAGDTYTWTSTSPGYNTSDLNTAAQALLDDASLNWFMLLTAGVPADDTAAGALFGALDTKMAGAATGYRYVRSLMQAQDDVKATVRTAWAARASASKRVGVAYGFEYLTSPISGIAYKRPASWVAAARAAAVRPSEDLGKVRVGPALGIVSLIHDEFKTPEMDAARFTTLRSYIGKQGKYITQGRLFVASGSDFKYLQHGRVMDIGSTYLYAALLEYLNEEIRVDKDSGKILEQDALSMEMTIEELVRNAVTGPGYASSLSVHVDRTNNILSDETINTTLRIVPLAYGKQLKATIGFSNPALKLVAT